MLNPKILNWFESHIAAIAEAKPLLGGITTSVFRIHATDGKTYVLRVFDNEEMLEEDPDSCQHEAAALLIAKQTGLKSPTLIHYEPDASVCGEALLVMQALEGSIVLKPVDRTDWLRQSAEAMAMLHRANIQDFAWNFQRYCNAEDTPVPQWTAFPENWQRAIEILKSPEPQSSRLFIHRDFHPANLLWQNGKLSGVVDWVNACMGTIGNDVGHMRVNLATLYGCNIADEFLSIYQGLQPDFRYEPYWDIVAFGDFYLWGEEAPEVYSPWLDLGLTELTNSLILERAEDYLAHLLSQF
jgi:aminoglycoside phosphotransferase (APT) family kinase protein